jgi:hypothetical protein
MLQFLKEIKEIVRSGPPCQESFARGHKLKQSLNEVGCLVLSVSFKVW